ncbi:FERM domain-containing protein 4A, partial [Dermatophagoides pteronyssinus]
MCLIEKQPTYGVHFYEVKDKSKQPYWLGLSFKGIDQFSYADRRLPLKQFAWKQLENLYFRECKFSIEVRDLKRVVHTLSSINLYENAIEDPDTFDDLSTAICDPTTQVSVSRRTFGPCNVTVFVWFASTSSLTKCIWSMAISQHQFYIDRHINKSIKYQQRAKDDIVQCLNENHNRRRNQIKQLWFQQQQRNSYCSNNSIRNSLYSTTTTVSSSIDHSMNQQSSLTLPRNVTLGFNNHHQQRQYRLGSNTKSTSQHNNNNNNNNKSSSLISLNHIVQQQDVSGCLLDNRHPSLINNNNNNINNKLLSSSSSSSGVSRTNSQTTISSQHHSQRTTQLNRQQPFRHSTSTSSINKMSTTPTTPSSSSSSSSTIAVRGSWIRNSRLDRLRQLQLQLQNKMDELNLQKSNNVNENQVNHQLPTTNQIRTATNHPQQQQQARNQSSSLIFSSPYVNKYDTSVQSLLKSNERSNLYSVPNRRTSVALNNYVNLIMSSKNSLSSSNVQPPQLSQQQQQYQNHIYQNSQNLMSSKSSIQRRPQQPKTWFETDLDYHHMKFVKQQQSSSIYKPIIKPSNNLVF